MLHKPCWLYSSFVVVITNRCILVCSALKQQTKICHYLVHTVRILKPWLVHFFHICRWSSIKKWFGHNWRSRRWIEANTLLLCLDWRRCVCTLQGFAGQRPTNTTNSRCQSMHPCFCCQSQISIHCKTMKRSKGWEQGGFTCNLYLWI